MDGILAQLVEHLTFNQVVRGSNPRCLIRGGASLRKFRFSFFIPAHGERKTEIGGHGGIGRRAGFRCQWATVWVRVPLAAVIGICRPVVGTTGRLFVMQKVPFVNSLAIYSPCFLSPIRFLSSSNGT